MPPYVRSLALRLIEHLIRRTPSGKRVFFDPSEFPWVTELEANWTEIRAELDVLMTQLDHVPDFQQLSPTQYKLTDDDRWKVYVLYFYSHKAPRNCARCPRTTELVERIPGMTTAFFSILGPHKHLPEHRGPYAGVLRYHLGLLVPEPVASSRLKVAGEIQHWREGRSVVFDDSQPHEVWNESDLTRVVLFVDFIRPLPVLVAACNRLALRLMDGSPIVRDVVQSEYFS